VIVRLPLQHLTVSCRQCLTATASDSELKIFCYNFTFRYQSSSDLFRPNFDLFILLDFYEHFINFFRVCEIAVTHRRMLISEYKKTKVLSHSIRTLDPELIPVSDSQLLQVTAINPTVGCHAFGQTYSCLPN